MIRQTLCSRLVQFLRMASWAIQPGSFPEIRQPTMLSFRDRLMSRIFRGFFIVIPARLPGAIVF